MFASEGDSVDVGCEEPSAWGDRWDAGHPLHGADDAPDASAGVARRLQSRVDRHLWLLGRMQADPLQPEPAGLSEMLETSRRIRRDTETLLLLCGQDPGVRAGGPRRVADVLADVAAAAEEPRRVDVRPAPAATLTAGAATEMLHVLAELVDHVSAVYPGARVDVTCRVEEPAGVVVEVRADGAARYDPDGLGGRPAMAAAQRLAARSRSGIALRLSASGGGSVATVHCPGAVVTFDEPERQPMSWVADRLRNGPSRPTQAPSPSGRNGRNGTEGRTGGDKSGPAAGRNGRPTAPPAGPPVQSPSHTRPNYARPDFAQPDYSAADHTTGDHPVPDWSALDYPVVGRAPAAPDLAAPDFGARDVAAPDLAAPDLAAPDFDAPGFSASTYLPAAYDSFASPSGSYRSYMQPDSAMPADAPPAPAPVDELFGPMIDLGHLPSDDLGATPIFEAIASAWFLEDAPEKIQEPGRPVNGARLRDPVDWTSPSDEEWRAAAARAAQPDPMALTATGLPRRRPGSQLVPPPRSQTRVPERSPSERIPDRVRDRLSTYQRGLRQGRHRADPAPPPPDQGGSFAW